jgi:hypothetical protein
MSMSRERGIRTDDHLVTVISHWLARHVSDDELRGELDGVKRAELAPEQVEAVEELRAELEDQPKRAELERVARESLEAIALGG